jgi:head-tail adaptor
MRVHLNRPLVLQTPTRVADGAGGFALTWVSEGVLWGEVVPGAGSDAAGVEVTLAKVPYRITVRGAAIGSPQRPRPDQRFADGARHFVILAVTERDPNGQYLICFAREESPQ